jgi:hypothetical protein
MKKLTYILVTVTFAFACFGLWAMLNVLDSLSAQSAQALPAFTKLLVGLRIWLLLLPIPAAGYCVYALVRRRVSEESGMAFIACAMSALCLVSFPVLMGVFLPCVVLMDQTWGK